MSMLPPMVDQSGQAYADGVAHVLLSFGSIGANVHNDGTLRPNLVSKHVRRSGSLARFLRPGLHVTGPAFLAEQSFADAKQVSVFGWNCDFRLASDKIRVKHTTTLKRGSAPCVNHLSFLQFVFFLLLAACSPTRPRPVRALARHPARPLARSRTTTLLNRPSSAARLASLRATPAFAADLAPQSELMISASRGTPSAGRLHFRARVHGPARASEGREPCSRKS